MSTTSKRRRTSPTSFVAVDDQENNVEGQPKPTTSKKASYQTPTKASLARSNPGVLKQVEQAKDRRESESNRRRSLLDHVLHKEIPETVPEVIQDEPPSKDPQAQEIQEHVVEGTSQAGTLADDVVNAFARPIENAGGSATEKVLAREISPVTEERLKQYTPGRQRMAYSVASPNIVPRLVPSTGSASQTQRQRQERGSQEPDLPPTPRQDGEDTGYQRPTGLISSSPNGRRKFRNKDTKLTSSPLKPRAPPPVIEPEVDDQVELASGIGDEDEEDNGPVPTMAADENLDEASDDPVIQEKQRQLRDIQAQLHSIQADYRELKTFTTSIAKARSHVFDFTDTKVIEDMDLALTSLSTPPKSLTTQPEEDEKFKKYPGAFLTLFAPSNLQVSYETFEKKGRACAQKVVYQMTLVAPEPWPPTALNITFDTTVDLETNLVDEIMLLQTQVVRHAVPLQKWIEHRLHEPLLKTDLATFAAGAGRYFDESVKRAKVFKYLSDRLDSSTDEFLLPTDLQSKVTDTKEVLFLLPYLTASQKLFTSPSSTLGAKGTGRPPGNAKQLMLVYEISLNWVGQPEARTDIHASGIGAEVVKHARMLFKEVEAVKGVVEAFEAVWEVCGMKGQESTLR